MIVDDMDRDAIDQRHQQKMVRKKAARDKIMAGKSMEKGLLIVHTGKGKGKSTAAFGMVMRGLAHGFRIGVVQFIKGPMATGERRLLQEHFSDQCEIHAMGEGFTWETQDRQRDIAAARLAWEKSKVLLADSAIDMVLLDELNIVLRYEYLLLDEVLSVLRDRLVDQHVIITGRNASQELITLADLVSEMSLVKHPFRSGVKAQRGIEF